MVSEQSAPQPRSGGRGLIIAGSVVTATALIMIVVSSVLVAVSIGGPLTKMFSSPSRQTPVDVSLVLESGRYSVFERTGRVNKTGPVTTTSRASTTLTAGDVEVTGPDGIRLTTSDLSGSETLTRNETIWTGAVRFTVPADGTYQVRIPVPAGTQVVIAPAFGSALRPVLGWLAAGALSVVALTSGIVLLIFGLVRRHRSRRSRQQAGQGPAQGTRHSPPSPDAGPPSGWYPAPDTPGRERYWDGVTWTDQLR